MSRQLPIAKTTASAMRKAVRSFVAGTAGAALVEFTLFAPMLVMMIYPTMDLGFGIYRLMEVQNVQAGAQYAIINAYSSSSIQLAVTQATAFTGVSASPSPSEFCGCPSATTGVRYLGVLPCSTYSTCSDGSKAGTYVTVYAQATYTPIVAYNYIFNVPASYTFNAQATVRIQ